MRSAVNRWDTLASTLVVLFALTCLPSIMHAQGGEPRYFAIRGAKVIPVSGPPIENATILIARGVITAVGKDLTIPDEAWIIDGKGLIVYPGLFDAFTDVGIAASAAPSGGGEALSSGPRRPSQGERAMGPEDRPGSTAWRSGADEVSLSDKRIES